MPLHLDYRPKSLEEFCGNQPIKDSIWSIMNRKDRPHSYLFHGPSGCGKTTLARIMLTMLEIDEGDVVEYNASDARGIDTIRDITRNSKYAPIHGSKKGFIMDEAHKLTNEAQNAFLKLLEEPPSHVYFFLCTTDPRKLLETIRQRCTAYQVRKLVREELSPMLKDVLKKEKVTNFPQAVITEIAKQADGSPRKALTLLDSVIDIEDETRAFDAVQAFTFGDASTIDLCRIMLENQIAAEKWRLMSRMIQNIEEEPESIRYAILTYFMKVMFNTDNPERVSQLMKPFLGSFIESNKAGLTYALYQASKI